MIRGRADKQKMQILQQRLELASVKATHGWADKSIGEIERTMSPPPRRRSFKAIAPIRVDPYTYRPHPYSPSSPSISSAPPSYNPPSPSRPWQLIDVLWQPLPPSSRPAPASPRKRVREDSGRRNSSSGAYIPERMRKEKRSYSHSTTTQDVDAANALAFMHSDTDNTLRHSISLPIPTTPPRPRSSSFAHSPPEPPRSAGRRAVTPEPGEEDRSAADLMMFLAHSPSPLRKAARTAAPASPGTARVLFGDGEKLGKSNLAMAPPITANDGNGFGSLM